MIVLFLLSRLYWPIDVAQFARHGSPHTHVRVDGFVTYVAAQEDGDLHIRICDAPGVQGMVRERCIIAECIEQMPCSRPPLRSKVRIEGISRRDPEHRWNEVHPIESIKILKPE
jgi:hypothetical protein